MSGYHLKHKATNATSDIGHSFHFDINSAENLVTYNQNNGIYTSPFAQIDFIILGQIAVHLTWFPH